MTKQRLYEAIEDLFRIYVEFIANNYGKRIVDIPTPPEVRQQYEFIGQEAPEEIQQEFDFSRFKDFPMMLKLDVGASTYYSEIASMQTLDQLLQMQMISRSQYLERIPDSFIPRRRALIAEIKREEEAQAQAQQMMAGMEQPQAAPAGDEFADIATAGEEPEIHGGRGYGSIQRAINAGA
jgi:hypothetical protein